MKTPVALFAATMVASFNLPSSLTAQLEGPLDPKLGWVVDFADVKAAFRPLHERLDHNYLNEVEGLDNPTSENIAKWIWQRLAPKLPKLSKIVVGETCTAGCIYTGD